MKSLLCIYLFLSAFFFCSPIGLFAQDLEEEVRDEAFVVENDSQNHAFIIDGQVRTRGEYRHGAVKPLGIDAEAAAFVNERARLSIGYASRNIQFQLSAQHAGVWGDTGITGSNNGFSLNEAWGQVSTNNHLFSARVGRQALSYDNGRILGTNDWATTGYFHNAAKLTYQDDWNKVHLVGAFNQNEERTYNTYYNNDSTGLYKNLEVLWYHFGNESFPLQASVLLMNAGYEAGTKSDSKTIYRQTMGGNLTLELRNWSIQAEGYYQCGKLTNDLNTSAWMAALNVNYSIKSLLTLGVGYDYLSGSKADDTENHSFISPYGSVHSFYGSMDYFGNSYFTAMNSGLSDIHFDVKCNASKKWFIRGTYHFFSTTADFIRLSHEVDLSAKWQFLKDASLTGGYSIAFNTTNMSRHIGGYNKRMQYFAFLQLNIAPRLLFHRW